MMKNETPVDRMMILRKWMMKNVKGCKNNDSAIQRMLGLGGGFFATLKRQSSTDLRDSTYEKIKEAYPAVNTEWIRTGPWSREHQDYTDICESFARKC